MPKPRRSWSSSCGKLWTPGRLPWSLHTRFRQGGLRSARSPGGCRTALSADQCTQVRLQQAERGASATQKAFAAATQSLAELQQESGAERRKVSSLESRLRQVEGRCAAAASALDEERAKHEAARQELQERVWDAQEHVGKLTTAEQSQGITPRQEGADSAEWRRSIG